MSLCWLHVQSQTCGEMVLSKQVKYGKKMVRGYQYLYKVFNSDAEAQASNYRAVMLHKCCMCCKTVAEPKTCFRRKLNKPQGLFAKNPPYKYDYTIRDLQTQGAPYTKFDYVNNTVEDTCCLGKVGYTFEITHDKYREYGMHTR